MSVAIGHAFAFAPAPKPAAAPADAGAGAGPVQGVKSLAFQGVPAIDVDRAVRFWTERFGLTLVSNHPLGVTRWVMFDIPGAETRLVLMPMYELPDTAVPALVFAVDDIRGTLSRLEARGVAIRRGVRPAEWNEDESTALVEDSEGNLIMLASTEAP